MTIVDRNDGHAVAGTAGMEAIDISTSVFVVATICLIWWIFIIREYCLGDTLRRTTLTPSSCTNNWLYAAVRSKLRTRLNLRSDLA